MGYRLSDKQKEFLPCHINHLDNTASHTIITVDNGTISHILIPCFYGEHHNKMLHDHFGWPSPSHVDRSCQLPPGCEHVSVPIDMKDEGYHTIKISMINPPSGLVVSGSMEYGAINLRIEAMCDSAITSDLDVVICIYAIGDFGSYLYGETTAIRNVVLKGKIHIVAGPIR